MKGQILHLDASTGTGLVRGEDGRRYAFGADDLQGAGQLAHAGVAVDFEPQDGRALAIYPDPGRARLASASRALGSKNKMVAGLLALFLGSWGVHKFYLGRNGAGLIMLACGLLGWMLFFVPTAIVGAIAFVEAIIYMTRTDEQFHETYEVRGKSWF